MIDCAECEARLRPESPHQPFFDPRHNRYLPPLCDSCPGREGNLITLERRLDYLEIECLGIPTKTETRVVFVPMPAPKPKAQPRRDSGLKIPAE